MLRVFLRDGFDAEANDLAAALRAHRAQAAIMMPRLPKLANRTARTSEAAGCRSDSAVLFAR